MSEILDALKRSEAARLGDEVPTPMPAPVWHASKPRPVWPWLAVLGVAFVVLFGLWQNRSDLWPERFPAPAEVEPETSKPRVAETKPESTPMTPPTSASKPEHLRTVPPTEAPVPATPSGDVAAVAAGVEPDASAPAYVAELAPTPAPVAPAVESMPAVPPTSAAPVEVNPAVPAPTTVQPASQIDPAATASNPVANETPVPAADPNAALTPAPMPEPLPMPPAVSDPAASNPVTSTDPLPDQSAPQPAPSGNPDDLLPRYEQLPYSLRRDLPPVKFSMHRYADDPNQRFVVYKERRISDNGVLGQDLWLKRVLPDGAVLEFRGTEFRVGRD